jgi:hypothetical protein
MRLAVIAVLLYVAPLNYAMPISFRAFRGLFKGPTTAETPVSPPADVTPVAAAVPEPKTGVPKTIRGRYLTEKEQSHVQAVVEAVAGGDRLAINGAKGKLKGTDEPWSNGEIARYFEGIDRESLLWLINSVSQLLSTA